MQSQTCFIIESQMLKNQLCYKFVTIILLYYLNCALTFSKLEPHETTLAPLTAKSMDWIYHTIKITQVILHRTPNRVKRRKYSEMKNKITQNTNFLLS